MTLQGRYARHENKEISKLLIGTCCMSLLVVLYQLAIAVPRSELQSTTDGFHHGVAAVPCNPLSTRQNLDKFQAGSNKYTSKLDEQSQLSTRSKQTICSLRSMHFATRPTAFGKCKKAKKINVARTHDLANVSTLSTAAHSLFSPRSRRV